MRFPGYHCILEERGDLRLLETVEKSYSLVMAALMHHESGQNVAVKICILGEYFSVNCRCASGNIYLWYCDVPHAPLLTFSVGNLKGIQSSYSQPSVLTIV